MTKPSKPRVRLKKVSDKQAAKRKAAGESFLRSSVRPSASKIAHQRKPIKAKPRNASERERIYGSAERIAWLKSQPCVGCGLHAPNFCDVAHVRTGGMGRKADASLTVPLCPPHSVYRKGDKVTPTHEGCHAALHRLGVKTFERDRGLDLLALAAKTQAEWQAYTANVSV